MSKPESESGVVDVDQLTREEIEDREQKTVAHIAAIKSLWSGATRLQEAERKRSPGRNLTVLGAPLAQLFGVLRTHPQVAKAFDVLGDQDDGEDPERFEVELLELRLFRVQAERRVADALGDLARHLDDDALVAGESVVGPGLLALGLARALAKSNPTFRSALSPVLDAFREMTKRARKRGAEKRAAAKAAAKP